MPVETKNGNFSMYKYTLFVYIYTITIERAWENRKKHSPKEGVVVEHLQLSSTYSEAWNSILHLLRRVLPEVPLRLLGLCRR
jgi:hypothetical protein